MKTILLVPVVVLLIIGSFFLGRLTATTFTLFEKKGTTEVHSVVLEKVHALGKMELVKYEFQDVVTHTTEYDWWPDPKVMLMVYGEAVGCIDFLQIDSSAILVQGDSLLMLSLPAPEICYVKVDHEKSKVFNSEYTYFSTTDFIDDAYQVAEAQIGRSAQEAQILEQTRFQATTTLVPMLEALSGKKVMLDFPLSDNVSSLPEILPKD